MASPVHEDGHIRENLGTESAHAEVDDAGEDQGALQGDVERRILRKLDFVLLPFLALLFLVNSLDRSNVGNAETAKFTEDCGLKPDDLNTAVALFFAFFVAFQPIGAAFGRRFGMRRWVPPCMFIWGLCTGLHVWVRQRWQLILLRILIGILEAGFYPTTVAYLSLFYTRYEYARRLGAFYGQYALAGALGGLLSYLIFAAFPRDESGDQSNGVKSWQILFISEGGITMIIAAVGFFWLPDSAEQAWFLRKDEREWAGYRIWKDRQGDQSPVASARSQPLASIEGTDGQTMDSDDTSDREEERLLPQSNSTSSQRRQPSEMDQASSEFTDTAGLSARDILDAFSDWKVFYLLLVNILSAIPAAAFAVFLPLVVQGMGFEEDAASTNLLTVPPFLAGAVVLLVFVWWSDAIHERLRPILYGLGILLVGLTATVMVPHTAVIVRYVSLCVLLGGSFIASPLTIAWLSDNIQEPGKRSIVLGINGWGNLSGVLSSLMFSERFGPYYTVPFFATLACVLCAFFGFVAFRWLLKRENQWRADVLATWDAAAIRAEKKFGEGPLENESSWKKTLYNSWLIQRCVGTSQEEEEEQQHVSNRRGEEKLTFRYGM